MDTDSKIKKLTLELAKIELRREELKRQIRIELEREGQNATGNETNNARETAFERSEKAKTIANTKTKKTTQDVRDLVRVTSKHKRRFGDIANVVSESRKGTTYNVRVVHSAGKSKLGEIYRVHIEKVIKLK